MKSFIVHISQHSSAAQKTLALRQKVNSYAHSAEDQLVMEEAEKCIHDLESRAQAQHSVGTSIQISKLFKLSSLEFTVSLQHPQKVSFVERIRRRIRGDV